MTPSHSDNAYASESVVAQDAGLDIKDLIGILRRRKKVILATVVAAHDAGRARRHAGDQEVHGRRPWS